MLNYHHIANEVALYFFGLLVIQFSMLDDTEYGHLILTWTFILLFMFWLAINIITIVWQSLIFIK